MGGEAVFGEGGFRFLAHIIGVLLGVKGAGVMNVDESLGTRPWNSPGIGKGVKAGATGVGFVFPLHGAEGVHQGDGDVGENGSAARGDLVFGESGDEAGEKDGDVGGGAELVEIADKVGEGVFLGLVAETEWGIGAGGRGAATAAGRRGVGAAWERVRRGSWEIAFHFGPRIKEIGGVPRCFLQRVRKGKKGKEMSGIQKMKEWGSD